MRRPFELSLRPCLLATAILLATSSGFACWTSGGLETQLFTVLVVAALDAVVAAVTQPAAIRRAGALLALSALTRPEGLLVAGVLGVVHLVTLVSRTSSAWARACSGLSLMGTLVGGRLQCSGRAPAELARRIVAGERRSPPDLSSHPT